MKIRKTSILILIAIALGCNKEQEKFVQAEFDKIQAHWKVESFQVINVSDELKNTLKTGEVLFEKCNYSKKGFEKKSTACSGEFQINEILYTILYGYNYESKQYWFKLIPVSSKNTNGFVIKPGMEEYNVIQLMNGEWQVDILDNRLVAKQTKNDQLTNIQISFIATKK